MMVLRRIAEAFLASLILAMPLQADTDAAETAARASELLEQAGIALMEADGARDRVEALTQTVRAYEEGLLALREGVRQAALRERTILLVFEAERDRLARLLAVLQTIESSPAPALLLHPSGALGTARSGMIVSDITPAVAREAQALRAQLEELALMRALQDGAVEQLQAALNEVQDARSALSQAIADRVSLPARFATDADAMRELVESVDSLDSFAEMLRADPASSDVELPDFASTRGSLPWPVIGSTLRNFGETDAAGVARPGIVLATRPRALVTAPRPASIRYAGPLLDYGNVIILEPEANYLLVLAGLGDLFVTAGELVSFDAPLGMMPGDAPLDSEELLNTAPQTGGGELTETLYIELRESGSPVDTSPWFAD